MSRQEASSGRTARIAVWCLAGCLGLSGCASQDGKSDATGKPAVTINELALTPSELRQDPLAVDRAPDEWSAATGEEPEWLSRLIERELLVQEAQRLGLDRKQEFMGTIERFWKEALIKQLVNLKGQELASQTRVDERDLEASYERLRYAFLARIVTLADEPSANQLAQATEFDDARAALGAAVLADSGWQRYAAGMVDPALEQALTTTEPGTSHAPLARSGRWIVVRVAERQTLDVPPLAELRDEIRRTMWQQQQAQAMEQWVSELRQQAHIVVDYEAIALP